MSTKIHSRLIDIVVVAIALILGGYALVVYSVYPTSVVRDFIAVLGVGLALTLSGYIFVVKTVFLTGGKR